MPYNSHLSTIYEHKMGDEPTISVTIEPKCFLYTANFSPSKFLRVNVWRDNNFCPLKVFTTFHWTSSSNKYIKDSSWTSSLISFICVKSWCFADWAYVLHQQPLFYAIRVVLVTTIQSSQSLIFLELHLTSRKSSIHKWTSNHNINLKFMWFYELFCDTWISENTLIHSRRASKLIYYKIIISWV